jgi:hypothetical protein
VNDIIDFILEHGRGMAGAVQDGGVLWENSGALILCEITKGKSQGGA